MPAFAVLFSTTPAVTGGLGQVEVAAAGAYLEAVAARRAGGSAVGRVPTLAVHWEPYQWGGWLVAGVGGAMGGVASEDVEADLAAHGVAEERSGAALERLLASPLLSAGTAAALVSARDLPGLIAEIDSVTAEVLIEPDGARDPGRSGPRSPPPTSRHAMSSRRSSPPSGRSCSASSRSAARTASSSWGATRCCRSRSSPRSSGRSASTCR